MLNGRAVVNWLRGVTDRTASKMLHGVDVSSFQGRPEQWRAEAGAITWAAVKITELEPSGLRYVNPDAADDWSWLHRNSKGRIGYLFGHPSVSAKETVSFFLKEMGKLGLHDGDAIALDIEVTDGLGPSAVDAWCAEVTSELHQKTGRRPLVYTFLSFAESGNCSRLGDYPLWIADPSSRAGHPQVPKPWKTWTIHQYNISGAIDRDLAKFTSRADMSAKLGKPKRPDMKNLGGTITSPLCSQVGSGEDDQRGARHRRAGDGQLGRGPRPPVFHRRHRRGIGDRHRRLRQHLDLTPVPGPDAVAGPLPRGRRPRHGPVSSACGIPSAPA